MVWIRTTPITFGKLETTKTVKSQKHRKKNDKRSTIII